ncbi:efflux transporter periplasmic adaptor subunit [Niastella koreensis]|uniref:Efflux transporter, RND family, MFP subunit n=2 Tax=Niastella koreensis TaxID=354356 RepID=G8TAX3_NIAKG|nr:HlyD family efflux transporter periplasmic adaptor subunit [Niastella koreensis]AEW00316.1 efflux transporter, RND family, MFP subunit [Niastella koreensis GR20-10]OQP52185.1 efflux transporter periplasmic adaptor subunit [Niastella koreensis]
MDKLIESEMLSRKKKRIVWTVLMVLVMVAVATWGMRSFFAPSLKQSDFTTAVVEKGDVENTLTASGEVMPEFEETITSPINASIQLVLMDAGNPVKAGQSVLTLDKSSTQTGYEKLKFQLESKRNDLRKLKLELDKSFYDLKSNNDIKQLHINSYEAAVENANRLYKAGGGTRENIEQAEMDLSVAKLEKQQLENEIKNKQQTMQVEIREAQIAADIQENDLHELERKLQLANIVASHDGVVTWVNKNIGTSIAEGEPLARIADLRSFKVQGSIADSYLDQLHNGLPAIIRIGETQVKGKVVNIQPAVQNGIVTFDIQLNKQDNQLLRPNMKVDVFLVTAAVRQVWRVANGAAFKGASPYQVFVVRNGKAIRRTVHTGLSNFDYIELKDNIQTGDVVITSDMSEFKNTQEIIIRN